MQKAGVELDLRDIAKDKLTVEELDQLIGDRDYKLFLNSRNEIYRERNMKEHPPSRAEALKLIAQEPNLMRRPLVIRGSQIVLGYDEEALKKIAKG